MPLRPRFNPRSPRGERRNGCLTDLDRREFQSTLPARGATTAYLWATRDIVVSIHAPRAGSDGLCQFLSRDLFSFNPRSPRGERPPRHLHVTNLSQFQSTLPARGATFTVTASGSSVAVSIHAPRAGSDVRGLFVGLSPPLFQSTLPARGATRPSCRSTWGPAGFNPRSPRGERPPLEYRQAEHVVFQSTLPARGATSII